MRGGVGAAALLVLVAALAAVAVAANSQPNPYRVLRVPRTATQAEIRAAYRELALELHPDKRKDDGSRGQDFVRVQQAYELLSNKRKRREYDSGGSASSSSSRTTWRSQHYRALSDYHELRDVVDPVSVRLRASNYDVLVPYSDAVWVVYFYSAYCPLCDKAKPAWREFTAAADGLVRAGTVHTDYEGELARRLGVRRVPAVLGVRSEGGRVRVQRFMEGSPREAEQLANFAGSLLPRARPRSSDVRVPHDRVGALLHLAEGRQSVRARLMLRVLRGSELGDTMTFQAAAPPSGSGSVLTVMDQDGGTRATVRVEPAATLVSRARAHRHPAVPLLHGGNWWPLCYDRPCLVRLGEPAPVYSFDDDAGAQPGRVNCRAQRAFCRIFGGGTRFALVDALAQRVHEFAGESAPAPGEVRRLVVGPRSRWRRVGSSMPFPVDEAGGGGGGGGAGGVGSWGLEWVSDAAQSLASSAGMLLFLLLFVGQVFLR